MRRGVPLNGGVRRAVDADDPVMRFGSLLLALAATCCVWVPSARPAESPQEMRFFWVQTSSHPDKKKGAWTSTLVNEVPQFARPAGTKVGGEVGFSRGSHVVGAIKLPGGVLEYSGKVKHLPRNAGIVVPVIDGSGTFAGVTGTYTRSKGDRLHPHATILVLRLHR
jgi:hypothetical protein